MAYISKKLKVVVLGSGNIGTDLLVKILRSPFLECSLFIGRNPTSQGIAKAISLGVRVSDLSIEAIVKDPDSCDLVFDATSAVTHKYHAPILERLNKLVIDLTPAGIGKLCVPAINLKECLNYRNVNMITCGGQASAPLVYVISLIHKELEYIEVVSAIASRSAGPATRENIDEYIEITENAIKSFSGCKKAKAILILNPAQPCVNMQTTIFVKIKNPNIEAIKVSIEDMVRKIQTYVPGYKLIVPATPENDRLAITVRVQGFGDYLPSYAGNLDIINCAAIAMAEEYAKNFNYTKSLIR